MIKQIKINPSFGIRDYFVITSFNWYRHFVAHKDNLLIGGVVIIAIHRRILFGKGSGLGSIGWGRLGYIFFVFFGSIDSPVLVVVSAEDKKAQSDGE